MNLIPAEFFIPQNNYILVSHNPHFMLLCVKYSDDSTKLDEKQKIR